MTNPTILGRLRAALTQTELVPVPITYCTACNRGIDFVEYQHLAFGDDGRADCPTCDEHAVPRRDPMPSLRQAFLDPDTVAELEDVTGKGDPTGGAKRTIVVGPSRLDMARIGALLGCVAAFLWSALDSTAETSTRALLGVAAVTAAILARMYWNEAQRSRWKHRDN